MRKGNQKMESDWYLYEGAVMQFEKVVAPKFRCITRAKSVKQAASNAAFRYKTENGLQPNAKVLLAGNIRRICPKKESVPV